MLLLLAIVVGAIVIGLALSSMTFERRVTGLFSTSSTETITGETAILVNPTCVKAWVGTLSTRTSGTVGVATVATGHSIVTGTRFDLYWTNADGSLGKCYGCIAGTVASPTGDTSIPIASTAGGDALPILTTVIYLAKCNDAPLAITGNNLQALALSVLSRGYFVFSDGSDIIAKYVTATTPYSWKTTDADTNPLASASPTKVWVSTSNFTDATDTNQKCEVLVN